MKRLLLLLALFFAAYAAVYLLNGILLKPEVVPPTNLPPPASALAVPSPTAVLTSNQTIVGELPTGVSPTISPDRRHFAYIHGGTRVIQDRRPHREFDSIAEPLLFSPSGDSLAYAALRSVQTPSLKTPSFKMLIVLNGVEQQAYDDLGTTRVFSADGRRFAYTASDGRNWFVVLDGNEGPRYDGILDNSLVFSDNGTRFAYAARRGAKRFVVVESVEHAAYDDIGVKDIVFTPDSNTLLYHARLRDSWFVVVNGNPQRPYDDLTVDTLTVSPDSRRIAYAARRGKQRFIVVDGVEQLPSDGVASGTVVFSQDGAHLAYVIRDAGRWRVVLDGVPQETEIATGAVRFAPDSRGWAYATKRGAKTAVAINGTPGAWYDEIGENSLRFGRDGRLAYVARSGAKWFVVLNDQAGPSYPAIGMDSLTFSPDGKHLAYAVDAAPSAFVVCDGREGERFDLIVLKGGPGIVFDSPNEFHYLAMRGNTIYLVQERIKEGDNPSPVGHQHHALSHTVEAFGFSMRIPISLRDTVTFGGIHGPGTPATTAEGGLMAHDVTAGTHNIAVTWHSLPLPTRDTSSSAEAMYVRQRLRMEVDTMAQGELAFTHHGDGTHRVAGHAALWRQYSYGVPERRANGITSVWYCAIKRRGWMFGVMSADGSLLESLLHAYLTSFRCH